MKFLLEKIFYTIILKRIMDIFNYSFNYKNSRQNKTKFYLCGYNLISDIYVKIVSKPTTITGNGIAALPMN